MPAGGAAVFIAEREMPAHLVYRRLGKAYTVGSRSGSAGRATSWSNHSSAFDVRSGLQDIIPNYGDDSVCPWIQMIAPRKGAGAPEPLSKTSDDTYGGQETQQRFEKQVRAALNARPKPLQTLVPVGLPAQSKKRLAKNLRAKAGKNPRSTNGTNLPCRVHSLLRPEPWQR
jgi:hypothetical protein